MDFLTGERGEGDPQGELWGFEEEQGGATPPVVVHEMKDLNTGIKRFAGSRYDAQPEWFPFFWSIEREQDRP